MTQKPKEKLTEATLWRSPKDKGKAFSTPASSGKRVASAFSGEMRIVLYKDLL